ncbi:MAG: transcription termination/antitermination protein NusA [Chloroflexi bacterium]|nr:transcription termination/antitermination protein NusA [Chloroflexota bacterium]
MKSDFLIALTQLAAERNLPREMVLSAIEAALASAYRRDNATTGQDITVRLNPATGEVKVLTLKTVVEPVSDPRKELTLTEARRIKRDAALGDVVELEAELQNAGRIAAQTAKQVVMQRLREAERELVYAEFAERAGEVLTGTVQRGDPRYGGPVTLDLNGRAEAILPPSEQTPGERLRVGQKVRIYVVEVKRSSRGPEIVVSRTHRDLLRRLLEQEVPEVYNGIVEIKAIAREPGSRSKVAVSARQEGVDPVGACVGLRGIRIQNIVNELQGERIDVVQWHRDPAIFIASSLSPAQVVRVAADKETQAATVVVPDRHLSLAIGKEGQNVRLAAKLTGWKIDIKSSAEMEAERLQRPLEAQAVATAPAASQPELAVVEAVAVAPAAQVEAPVVKVEAPAARIEAEEVPQAAAPVAAKPEVALVAEAPAPVEAQAKSVEEQLAEEAVRELAVPAPAEEEAEEEEEPVEEGEDVWQVPAMASTGIRFAEDILGGPVRAGKSRGGRKRKGRGGGDDPGGRRGGGRRGGAQYRDSVHTPDAV